MKRQSHAIQKSYLSGSLHTSFLPQIVQIEEMQCQIEVQSHFEVHFSSM